MSTDERQSITLVHNKALNVDSAISIAWPYPGEWRLDVARSGLCGSAVAAHATNAITILVTNDTTSTTWIDHDTLTGQEGALTADTLTTTGLSSVTGTGREISSGDVIKMVVTNAGAGLAWDGGATIVATKIQG